MRIQILVPLLAACLLPGCSVPADPPAKAAAPAAAAQAAPAASTAGLLSVDPLTTCDGGQAIELAWDVAGSRPDLTRVQVLVGDDGEPQVFAEGGARGTETTGPWAGPGTVFRLVDPATGETLDRITLAGPDCRAPAGP